MIRTMRTVQLLILIAGLLSVTASPRKLDAPWTESVRSRLSNAEMPVAAADFRQNDVRADASGARSPDEWKKRWTIALRAHDPAKLQPLMSVLLAGRLPSGERSVDGLVPSDLASVEWLPNDRISGEGVLCTMRVRRDGKPDLVYQLRLIKQNDRWVADDLEAASPLALPNGKEVRPFDADPVSYDAMKLTAGVFPVYQEQLANPYRFLIDNHSSVLYREKVGTVDGEAAMLLVERDRNPASQAEHPDVAGHAADPEIWLVQLNPDPQQRYARLASVVTATLQRGREAKSWDELKRAAESWRPDVWKTGRHAPWMLSPTLEVGEFAAERGSAAIRNRSDHAVDLGGWRLATTSGHGTFTFPDGFTLDAHASCAISVARPTKAEQRGVHAAGSRQEGDQAVLYQPSGAAASHAEDLPRILKP